MSVQPKVSVLVPSYNHGDYIGERIESIVAQSYSNFELFVIDDCSEDHSHSIISELQARYGFTYIVNEKNSGTPFSAWEKICTLATGDYIWICESDDVAEPKFLEVAVASMEQETDTVMFYCSSNIIDESSNIIGHTDSYFLENWKKDRWNSNFVADGITELSEYQLYGQTVPNMSSALFTTSAFKEAFKPFIKRLRLTGDWLFVGEVMKLGQIVYSHDTLSNFRKHEVTSRVRVKSARSQAEFILTKYHLFISSGQPQSSFSKIMSSDVIRFLYEPASWFEVMKALAKVSWLDSLKFGGLFFLSLCKNPSYIHEFTQRYKHAKTLEKI